MLGDGMTVEEILSDYPDLQKEDIQEAQRVHVRRLPIRGSR